MTDIQESMVLPPTQHRLAEAFYTAGGAVIHPWYTGSGNEGWSGMTTKEQIAAEDVGQVLQRLTNSGIATHHAEDPVPGKGTDDTSSRDHHEVLCIAAQEIEKDLSKAGLKSLELVLRRRRANKFLLRVYEQFWDFGYAPYSEG